MLLSTDTMLTVVGAALSTLDPPSSAKQSAANYMIGSNNFFCQCVVDQKSAIWIVPIEHRIHISRMLSMTHMCVTSHFFTILHFLFEQGQLRFMWSELPHYSTVSVHDTV